VGAQIIGNPSNASERWLVDTVRRHAQLAGIGMPEVAVYEAPEINAFATGANRNNALVAVSTGLLRHMTPDEADGMIAAALLIVVPYFAYVALGGTVYQVAAGESGNAVFALVFVFWGIKFVRFSEKDVVRHRLVQDIITAYERVP
jgi:hypothetical protein